MSRKNRLERRCSICEIPIGDLGKTGLCFKCNSIHNNNFNKNPRSPDSIAKTKEKVSASLKKKWEDKDYRERVIKGTSKPRKESFKKEQSLRIKKWFDDNPGQKKLRSSRMKRTWAEGRISHHNIHYNKSKMEVVLSDKIKEIYQNDLVDSNKTLRNPETGKIYFPDIFIPDLGIVIEFYGDYWHANPEKYSPEDIVFNKRTSREIWNHDSERIKGILNCKGVKAVEVIWQSDFIENPKRVLSSLDKILNWECCF